MKNAVGQIALVNITRNSGVMSVLFCSHLIYSYRSPMWLYIQSITALHLRWLITP